MWLHMIRVIGFHEKFVTTNVMHPSLCQSFDNLWEYRNIGSIIIIPNDWAFELNLCFFRTWDLTTEHKVHVYIHTYIHIYIESSHFLGNCWNEMFGCLGNSDMKDEPHSPVLNSCVVVRMLTIGIWRECVYVERLTPTV